MYWGRCIGECTGVVVLVNVLGSLYCCECTGVVVLVNVLGSLYWSNVLGSLYW